MAVTSLVLGIFSLTFSIIPLLGNIAFIPSILSIIFGLLVILKKSKEGETKPKKGFGIAGLILSIISIIIVYNMNSAITDSVNETFSPDSNITITDNSNVSSTDSSVTENPSSCTVGQSIQNKDLKITFISVNEDFKDYSKYADIKSGYKIIKADFEFENISSSDQLASSYDFNCYADGYDCEKFWSYDNSSFSSTLSIGKKAKGSVCFQVPIDSQSITLEYETDMWSSSKLTFTIK